jgi:hypothetical protein
MSPTPATIPWHIWPAYGNCVDAFGLKCHLRQVLTVPVFSAVWALAVMEILTAELRESFRKALHHSSCLTESLDGRTQHRLLLSEILFHCRGNRRPEDLVERLREDCVLLPAVQGAIITNTLAHRKKEVELQCSRKDTLEMV